MADADDFFEFNGFFKNHPKDPSRSAKWNIHTRYTWINFINLLFGDGAKTVEFRLHGPTFNEGKILNWMLICSAILDYAESADKVLTIDECSKLSLLTILNKSFGKDDANELMEYHNERSLNFKSLRAKFDDSYGYIDMMEDKNQVFKTILHK
jgi:hypothetical protein